MNTRVGVPTEVKPTEGRVGLTPAAAGELVTRGVEVGIQQGAGIASGYPDEIDRLKPGHLLFCYLHLAANADLTRRLCDIGLTALAFETVVEEGVQHFCVTNMPGVVPRSASEALSAAMLPYLMDLLHTDWRNDPRLTGAVNVAGGELVHPALRA